MHRHFVFGNNCCRKLRIGILATFCLILVSIWVAEAIVSDLLLFILLSFDLAFLVLLLVFIEVILEVLERLLNILTRSELRLCCSFVEAIVSWVVGRIALMRLIFTVLRLMILEVRLPIMIPLEAALAATKLFPSSTVLWQVLLHVWLLPIGSVETTWFLVMAFGLIGTVEAFEIVIFLFWTLFIESVLLLARIEFILPIGK